MHVPVDAVVYYHQRTKHQLNAYAKGPDSLDWDDQPNAFRRFTGCEVVKLPLSNTEVTTLFGDLDQPQQIKQQTLNLNNLGLLLELSFGLSAWKQFGPDRWALRCNPSSGNLHPTEAYVVCADSSLLTPGVYHYVSHDHQLEHRCTWNIESATEEVYIGLSSIHWREAWKYGERALRYCQHDIGHSLAALSYAAGCLGWTVELLSEVADAELAAWLGLDREADFVALEQEAPDVFCRLHPNQSNATVFDAKALSRLFDNATWIGKAEPLSSRHFYRWPIIDETAKHLQKPGTLAERWQAPHLRLPIPGHDLPASQLIRQRRSAQHFNAKANWLPLTDFYRMLSALLPNAKPPFSAWNWPPQVVMVLFIHRVEGLKPGLYLLPRNAATLNELKTLFSADFEWLPVDAPMELFRLTVGNLRQAAKTMSCHQPIASDSAFSLGMLARFSENINAETWRYRRLFWECGLLGQILYLEAEAAGVRGTGIGCFFDDAVHAVLGLNDLRWQSLYHFTVGEPLEDNRLQTLAAYGHLQPRS